MYLTSLKSLLCAALFLGACVDSVSEDGLGCPCAAGFACDVDKDECVAPTVQQLEAPTMNRCTRTAPECDVRENFLIDSFDSDRQLASLLEGRWLVCEGTPLADNEPDLIGYEFDGDGRFYRIVKNEADECERDYGFEREGTWYLIDISEQNPPGTYQLVLDWTGGGTGGMVPSFSLEPRKMHDGFGRSTLVGD